MRIDSNTGACEYSRALYRKKGFSSKGNLGFYQGRKFKMFCPKCGKQLNDNARFCTECGYQIKPVQSNTSVQPEKNVQPDPGMQQEQQVQPDPPAAEVLSSLAGMNNNAQALPNNKKKTIIIALIVVAAIIVLAFLGIKLFILDKNPAESVADVSSAADTESELPVDNASDAERTKAYAEVISDLQQKYGVGSYTETGEPSGLVIVREIDFDKDGTSELLCAFYNTKSESAGSWTLESPYCDETNCSMCYEVWGWQSGQATRLVHAPLLGSKAVDDFEIKLREQDGKIYMLQSDGYVTAGVSVASTIQNDQWEEVVHLYCNDYSGDPFDSDGNFTTSGFAYYNQGERISEEEYDEISAKWFNYGEDEVQVIPMWYGNAQFQQTCLTIQKLKGTSTQNTLETEENNKSSSPSVDVPQINLSNYVGEWISEEFTFESISIYEENEIAYVVCRASYRDGAILVSTEPAELTISGSTATAEARDSWGNTSSIYLDFEGNTFYATVRTVGNDLKWSLSMEKDHFVRLEDAPSEEEPDNTEYWFDTSYIDEASLSENTREDIMWARNEIYARHGYIFQNKEIQAAFEATDWYVPNPNYSDSLLNDIEKENLDTIISYEKKMGWRS